MTKRGKTKKYSISPKVYDVIRKMQQDMYETIIREAGIRFDELEDPDAEDWSILIIKETLKYMKMQKMNGVSDTQAKP